MRRPVCLVGLVYLLLCLLAGTLQSRPLGLDSIEGERICLTGRVDQKAQGENGWSISLHDVRLVTGEVSGGKTAADVQEERWGQNQSITQYRGVLCYMKEDAFDNQSVPKIRSYVMVEGICKPFSRATNEGQFDQQSYEQFRKLDFSITNSELKIQSGTYSKLREGLWQLRSRWRCAYEDVCGQEEAAFLTAVVLGDTSSMDEDLQNLFRQNGLAHILAVSGLHISLLGMGLYRLLRRAGLPVPLQVGCSIALVGLYGIMIDAGTVTLRAMVMFGIYLTAVLFGRTYDMATALTVAACVLVTGEPQILGYAGFLLSFGAILGILLFYPALKSLTGLACRQAGRGLSLRRRLWLKLCDSFLFSLSISLFLLPLQLYFYYEIQPYAIVLNLVVLPLFSVFLYLGFAGGAAAMLCAHAGGVLLLPCEWLFAFYRRLLTAARVLPGSRYICGRPQWWQLLLYEAAVFGIIVWERVRRRDSAGGPLEGEGRNGSGRGRKIGSRVLGLVLLQGAVLLLCAHVRWHTQITFLDVGQGDCCVVLPDAGGALLMDGGSSDIAGCAGRRLLPFLKANGVRCVDYAFVSHPDEDHMNGILECLETSGESGVRIRNLALSPYALSDERYRTLIEAAQAAGCRTVILSPGDRVRVRGKREEELSVRCLFPYGTEGFADTNDQSLMLELEACSFRFLFTGDMAEDEEGAAVLDMKRNPEHWAGARSVDVLKVAHHGSRYSTCEELLELLSPRTAVISCGKNNRYGHPHEETLQKLAGADCRVFLTKESGAVTVTLYRSRTGERRAKIEGYLDGQ